MHERTGSPLRHAFLAGLLLASSAVAPAAAGEFPWAGDWTMNGVRVASTTGADLNPRVASDGSGGAFIQWATVIAPGVRELRLLHLLANGQSDTRWPEGGLKLDSSEPGQADLIADGAGGVYVARWLAGQVTVTRYRQDGNISADWLPAGPLAIGMLFGTFSLTDSGELWHAHWGFSWLTVTRIRPDGSFVPSWSPPGKQLAQRGQYQNWVAVGRPGGISLLVRSSLFGSLTDFEVSYWEVEQDGRFSSASLGYGYQFGHVLRIANDAGDRRFTGFGTWAQDAYVQQPSHPRTWPEVSVALDASFPHIFTELVPDDRGGVFVKWVRSGPTQESRFGHVRSDGRLDDRWPLPESTFAVWPQQVGSSAILPDGQGNVFVLRWLEPGTGTESVLQRVREDGSLHPNWPAGGAVFRQGPGSASGVSATIDRIQGLFILWSDDRSGQSDLFIQRFSTSIPVGTRVELAHGEAVRGEIDLFWRLADPGAGPWFVEGSSDGLEWRPLGEAQPASEPRSWAFVDRRPVPGHTNHYRLTDARHLDVIGDITVWMPAAGRLQARLQTRGPDGAPCVVVSGAQAGALRAELRDVQGRVVDTRVLSSAGDETITLSWGNREAVAAGMYWVLVRQGDQRASTKLTVLR